MLDISLIDYIYFGAQSQDGVAASFCGLVTPKYRFEETPTTQELNVSSIEVNLTSVSQNEGYVFPKLKLNLTIHEYETIRVHWNFLEEPEFGFPFEIPNDIIHANELKRCADCNFIGRLLVGSDMNNFIFKLKGLNETNEFFTLKGIQLGQRLSILDARIFTKSDDAAKGSVFRGILGFGNRPTGGTSELFHSDGVLHFWNRKQQRGDGRGYDSTADSTSSHPFFMFESHEQKNSWRGLFSNNANAQSWELKSDRELGSVDIAVRATGGCGDVFLF